MRALLPVRGGRRVVMCVQRRNGSQQRARWRVKIKTSVTGGVIPGLVAGGTYFIIAFATGTSARGSLIGGIVVTLIALSIGFFFRTVYKRRAARPHE